MENPKAKPRKGRRTKQLASASIETSGFETRSRLANMPASTVFNTMEVLAFIGIGIATWDRWKKLKKTPPAIRLSARRLGYRKADLDAWLDARTEKRAA